MTYILSNRSIKNLYGVNPDLIEVVFKAIEISKQDFCVFEGLRTLEKQKENIAKGVSKTLNSKHLTGNAVDLVAWVNKNYSWEWEYYYPIADAMQESAIALGYPVVWGGCWDKLLNELNGNKKEAVDNYVLRRKRLFPGKVVFLDAPHFEISES